MPILDGEWFEDDIVARFRESLRVTFRENPRFIEEALGKDIRKYLSVTSTRTTSPTTKSVRSTGSSPSEEEFSGAYFMHRYNRDTVNLLLNDYLREFQNKLRHRRDHLACVLGSESISPPPQNRRHEGTDENRKKCSPSSPNGSAT